MLKKHGTFLFAAGILLLVVQFLILAFQYITGDSVDVELIISVEYEVNFKSFISEFWSGLAGCLLLVVLFVRRITKGPEGMLTLVGFMLWVIQILSRYESQPIIDFALTYLLGIIGMVLVGISALYDVYTLKSQSSDDIDFGK